MANTETTLGRRLRAEWDVLRTLAQRNPERLDALAWDDLEFRFVLHGVPALPLEERSYLTCDHQVRLVFPYLFPAVPMELFLQTPMHHPNIHPTSGFVCLWDRHSVKYTVEDALHRTVAILGWRLANEDAVHVMQPAALARLRAERLAIQERLAAPELNRTDRSYSDEAAVTGRASRPRLS